MFPAVALRVSASLSVIAACLLLPARALADDPKSGGAEPRPAESAALPTPSGTPAPAAIREEIEQLQQLAARIRALSDGSLDPTVEPQSLFDVSLQRSAAIDLEARRLRQLLATQPDAGEPDAGAETAASPASKDATPKAAPSASPVDGEAEDAGAQPVPDAGAQPPDDASPEQLAEWLWLVRVEVDRARLAFLQLPEARRTALLDEHAKRREERTPAASPSASASADPGKTAEAERLAALEAAKRARTEATRLVQEERARLLGIKADLRTFEADLAEREKQLEARAEQGLAWRRRVEEVITKRQEGLAGPELADRTYEELVRSLRATEDELSAALRETRGDSRTPAVGEDRLDTLGANVDRSAVDTLRGELTREEARLRRREAKFRREQARLLMQRVGSLNRDRLDLAHHLSSEKRSEIVSFGAEGLRQAGAELGQVAQVARYHLVMALEWLTDSEARRGTAANAIVATVSGFKVLAVLLPFIWWRRRASGLISHWQVRLANSYGAFSPPPAIERAQRWLAIYRNCRVSFEWLAVILVIHALLPQEIAELFEISLLYVSLTWLLGGKVIVDALNAIAAEAPRVLGGTSSGELRLRSLNLVGRVVVAFGLLLSLTERVVGAGTVYTWVLKLCWLAAIPIALYLIHWWRPVIFERLSLRRRKNRFVLWVEQQEQGWRGSIAAAVGGVYLMGLGLWRLVRHYLGGLEITRRLLAYWFRREAGQRSLSPEDGAADAPLGAADRVALDPEQPGQSYVPGIADVQVDEVIARIEAPGGGVFAVVGERGSGKTCVLRRIQESSLESLSVTCRRGGYAALVDDLAKLFGPATPKEAAALAKRIDARSEDNALLLDDAQHLIRPTIGGFDDFDRLMALARRASSNCAWILAFDDAIWRYLERARGVRPLFDDVVFIKPWSEESVAQLLRERSEAAGIEPSFERLVTGLPETADDIDRAEALTRARRNYYRVVWDYTGGNPGLALHFWRESLRVDADGDKVVSLFVVPDASDLERLPDATVFVLRAVLQLEPTQPDDIVAVTALGHDEVADALRYTKLRGYVEQGAEGYRITWAWFRAVTRLLNRRHLLAIPRGT